MMLPQLPQDKANHVLYGLLIFGVVGLYSPLAGLIAAVVAAAAKEAWDATGRGHVEFLDFLATSAGGAAGFYCSFI